MKKNKYDTLLKSFVSKDDVRFETPIIQGNFVYATDKKCLIKVPLSLCSDIASFKNYELDKTSNFEKFMADFEMTADRHNYTISDLAESLLTVEFNENIYIKTVNFKGLLIDYKYMKKILITAIRLGINSVLLTISPNNYFLLFSLGNIDIAVCNR